MRDFRILTDPLMLHNARVPLLVLALVFALLLTVGIVLAVIALRREKKRASQQSEVAPEQSGETPCS